MVKGSPRLEFHECALRDASHVTGSEMTSQENEDVIRDENENRGKLLAKGKMEPVEAEPGCCGRFCQTLGRCTTACCSPCLTEKHPLPPDPSRCERCKFFFMCPPHDLLARVMIWTLSILILWGIAWSITGKEALPGGSFFGLFVLFPCCVIGGRITQALHMPPLLGMILVGLALRNVPYINVAASIDGTWSAGIRSVALVVILIRAGLGLDPVALRRLSLVVIRLALLPCGVEAVTVAVCAYLLLGWPWIWGLILGFIHSAVSPAVVVPTMLRLQEQGLGTNKGIPTMVIAAGSIDDVLAISGFGICLGIAFSTGELAFNIARGPLEAIGGILFGIITGVLSWYLPQIKDKQVVLFRYIFLFGGGMFAIFGSKAADLPGAGALGCLTMAFVSAVGWRRQGWVGGNPMAVLAGKHWDIFQPLLFGLIGAAVDISKITAKSVGLGIGILFIGLTIRCIVAFLIMFRTPMNWKERFFVPIAWLPKATVQAALGSVAIDLAVEVGAPPEIQDMARFVLAMAALIIIITAPIGAFFILLSAPKLLKKTDPNAPLEEVKKPDDVRALEEGDDEIEV